MPSSFEKFSLLHGIVIAASALAIALLVIAGRAARSRSERAELAVRRSWVLAVILLQGFTQLWTNLSGRFDLTRTLPLHICDLVPWIGVAALLSGRAWTFALAYYWGIGLSGWAFIVPVLTHGPAHLDFWLFWGGHLQIIGTAAYLVAVLGHRPTARGLATTALATVIYSALVLPADIAWGADYGYLGRSSAAEPFGPWPARVAVLVAVEILLCSLLLLPWRWIPLRRPDRSRANPALLSSDSAGARDG